MTTRFNALQLNPIDNLAVALTNIQIGEAVVVSGINEEIIATSEIPYGHKVALTSLLENEEITKYGECMGISTKNIPQGDHIHVHNVRGLNEKERLSIVNQPLKI